MTKNIIVTDANGDIIGTTYLKRAKGLVKNGRACFAGDDTIRMSASDDSSGIKTISEEKSMIYITFKGEEWLRNDVDISFMSNPIDGAVTESLMLGSWEVKPMVAQSRIFMLTPNTDYRFVFWLNGGENEAGNETCEFRVAFFSNWENCNVYKLNRGYIRPLLHQKGWELYELPFRTPNVEGDVSVTFSFVANRAPMAVLPALEPSAYADLKDEPDEFEDYRPQRHNIVFKDGWPSITQYGGDKYSTEAIRKKIKNEKARESGYSFGNKGFNFEFSSKSKGEDDPWEEIEDLHDEIDDLLDDIEDSFDDLSDDFSDACDDLEDITSDEDFNASEHQSEADDIAGELQKLDNVISGFKANIDQFRGMFESLDKRMFGGKPDKVRAALEDIRTKVEVVHGSITDISDRISDISDRISDLND